MVLQPCFQGSRLTPVRLELLSELLTYNMCTSVRVVRYHTCPPFCPSGKAAECEQQSGHFSKQRSRKLENTAIFFVAGSRVGPKAGATVWDYMTEQVKPQHSFSSVRPVLVRGEEVCWALDRGRLVGTPQIQQEKTPQNPDTRSRSKAFS